MTQDLRLPLTTKGDEIRRLLRYTRQLETDLRDQLAGRFVQPDLSKIPMTKPPLAEVTKPNDPIAFLKQKGAEAVDWMLNEWNLVVQEPPGQNWERIDYYIRSPECSNWSGEDPYDNNGDSAWCGHFTSGAHRSVQLLPEIVEHVLQSTYRLWDFAKTHDLFVPVDGMGKGDTVIVGPDFIRTRVNGRRTKKRAKPWGHHITTCISPSGGTKDRCFVVEGNAVGNGPNGDRYEGVVTNERPILKPDDYTYYVKYVIRFKPEHYADWTG
jgi:hypothetical protein